MKRIFAILGAIFLVIATTGFLLIQQFLDNKISNKNSHNIEFISSQKETLEWIEKANSYRYQASLKKDNISIMKTLGVENNTIDKSYKVYLKYLKTSAIYTINALAALKKIGNKESDELVNKIDNLSEAKLTEAYLIYIKEAAEATYDLGNKIENNKKDILILEKKENVSWNFCFTSQLLGLICGLLAIIFKTRK